MKSFSATVALALLGVLGDVASASCGHGTSFAKRKVSISKRQEGGEVKTVEVGQFGYISTEGPVGWAGLSPDNSLCSSSTIQSPIDVTNTSTTLTQPGDLSLEFPNVESAEFENIGTTIEVVMEGKGAKTTVGGQEFELKQFHFHSPSEHTVNGEHFPLEMHMVHESADGSIAVIACHFQLSETGETTSLLTSVTEKIGDITAPGSITNTGALDFSALVQEISRQSMHLYSGSLTTPPCAEGLQFFITSQQLPLDVATYNKIKAVVGFNSRYPQNTPGQTNLIALAIENLDPTACAGAAASPAEAAPVKAAPVAAVHTAPAAAHVPIVAAPAIHTPAAPVVSHVAPVAAVQPAPVHPSQAVTQIPAHFQVVSPPVASHVAAPVAVGAHPM